MHDHCIQSVPAVALEKTICLVNDTGSNVWIIQGKDEHLGKVGGERSSDDLREVKRFWESDRAIELPGAAAATPEPFQVHAQDPGQGEHFDALGKKRWLTSVSFVLSALKPNLTRLDGVFVPHVGHEQQFMPRSSWSPKKEVMQPS